MSPEIGRSGAWRLRAEGSTPPAPAEVIGADGCTERDPTAQYFRHEEEVARARKEIEDGNVGRVINL